MLFGCANIIEPGYSGLYSYAEWGLAGSPPPRRKKSQQASRTRHVSWLQSRCCLSQKVGLCAHRGALKQPQNKKRRELNPSINGTPISLKSTQEGFFGASKPPGWTFNRCLFVLYYLQQSDCWLLFIKISQPPHLLGACPTLTYTVPYISYWCLGFKCTLSYKQKVTQTKSLRQGLTIKNTSRNRVSFLCVFWVFWGGGLISGGVEKQEVWWELTLILVQGVPFSLSCSVLGEGGFELHSCFSHITTVRLLLRLLFNINVGFDDTNPLKQFNRTQPRLVHPWIP